MPRPGPARVIPNTASRRASAGICAATQQTICADAQFTRPWVLVSFDRVSRYTDRKGRGRSRPAEFLFVEVGLPYLARPRFFAHEADTRDLGAPFSPRRPRA